MRKEQRKDEKQTKAEKKGNKKELIKETMENGKKSEIQIRSEEGKEKLKECIRNTVFFDQLLDIPLVN